jgi:hypothetical protein
VTAAGVREPPAGTLLPRPSLARAGLRLEWLYQASRRVPAALAALAACGAVLRAALEWHWIGGGDPGALQVPLLLEAGTASVIAVTAYSPFGEPERATGRWLPWLRLGTAVALTAAAVGALAAGATAAHLSDGTLAVLRNVAGTTGVGLLSAAVIGGALTWTGPMAYVVVSEYALLAHWTTPWVWPARPPHDRSAAICAALVFTAGIAVATARGARDQAVGDGGGGPG